MYKSCVSNVGKISINITFWPVILTPSFVVIVAFKIHYTAPTGEYNITAIVDNEKLTINVSNTTDSIIGDKSS